MDNQESYLYAQKVREDERFLRDAPGILSGLSSFLRSAPEQVTSQSHWKRDQPAIAALLKDAGKAARGRRREECEGKMRQAIERLEGWSRLWGQRPMLRSEPDQTRTGAAAIQLYYWLELRKT